MKRVIMESLVFFVVSVTCILVGCAAVSTQKKEADVKKPKNDYIKTSQFFNPQTDTPGKDAFPVVAEIQPPVAVKFFQQLIGKYIRNRPEGHG